MHGEKVIVKLSTILLTGTFALSILLTGCGIRAVTKGTRSESFDRSKTAVLALVPVPSTVAFWQRPDGSHMAIATSADSDNIAVYDVEKKTEIERIGKSGTKPGEFKNPGDIQVVDYIAFVLDRGNHRVQAFKLPEMKPFGVIGEDRLKNPSHIAAYRVEHGAYYLYVADSQVPAGSSGVSGSNTPEHILRFSIGISLSSAHSSYLQTFGYAPDAGYLTGVTSLAVDREKKHLLATEGTSAGRKSTVYTLDGDFIRKGDE